MSENISLYELTGTQTESTPEKPEASENSEISETEEVQPEIIPDILTEDKTQKSVEHFQSLYGKERDARVKLEQRLQELEGKLSSPQTRETKTPSLSPKPVGYNETDAYIDPESISWKWRIQKENYLEEVLQHQNNLINELNQNVLKERQTREQKEQFAQYKAYAIGEFQKAGLTPEESLKAYEWSTSEDSITPSAIAEFWKFRNQKPKPVQKPHKESEPLPPGILPGKTETGEKDFGQALFEYVKDKRI